MPLTPGVVNNHATTLLLKCLVFLGNGVPSSLLRIFPRWFLPLPPCPFHWVLQPAEKAKKAPKVKAPDINDDEFPGLPGAKPRVEEDANGDADGEKASGIDGDKADEVGWSVLSFVSASSLDFPIVYHFLFGLGEAVFATSCFFHDESEQQP